MTDYTYKATCSNEECEATIEVEVTDIEAGDPGCYTGAWENCYPGTGPSFSCVEEVTCEKCGTVTKIDSDDVSVKLDEFMGDCFDEPEPDYED